MANMVGVLRQLGDLAAFCWKGVVAADFVSCWTQLNESCRRQLVRRLEMAFSSPNIPPEILATLLNLAEFMEHDETPLPTDIRLLGALAKKCPAFAKALHYKEMEFEGACSNRMDGNLVAVVEAMIHINNQLHQHEAAVGILTYAQKHLGVQLKESWYEHNINVMMAACDTFRSGVVEQLRTHARRLRIPIFEQGYEKDPAIIAK